MKVNNEPLITADVPALSLAYQPGQTQSVSQAISVTSSNGIPLNYTVLSTPTNCGATWLPITQPSGTTPGTFTVTVNSGNLVPGICTASIAISAINAITGTAAVNSPLIIPVNMIVGGSAVLLVSPLSPPVFSQESGGDSARG